MTNVVTDLLGKRVTVWHYPDWGFEPSDLPRRGITGIVRAVSFGDYNPHRTEPAFHLLIQRAGEGTAANEMAGGLELVSVSGRTTVVPDPE